jgi:small subunit ribosomal protein S6
LRLQITSILRAGSTQPEITELLQKMSKIVLDRNGVLAGINSWGLQQLAYRMRAHQEYHTHGRYVQFKVIASPTALKELERNMKLDRR